MDTNNTAKIGVVTATIIGMNAMIGSGIFTAPKAMASNVGPAGILAYIFVVVSVWFMAQSLARVAQRFPQEGSFYTYAKQWGGHKLGLIAAGAYLVGLMIAMGLLAQEAGIYLQVFFPSISAQTLGIAALLSLVALNAFGVALSELGQQILIVCTVSPLVVSTLMCFSKFDVSNLTPFAPYGFTNVFKATRLVIFGFFGFECAASLFNVVKDPKKNVPKALTYAIIFVGGLYTLFIASIIGCIPLETFATPQPLTDSLATVFPNNMWVIRAIHISILSAIIGTIHSMIWSASSLVVSYLKNFKVKGIQKLIKNNVINHRTAVLAIGSAILFTNLTLKDPALFFNLTAMFIVFAYVMSMITLFTIPEERQGGQLIKTVLGISTASIIFIFAAEGLVQALIG